MDNIGGHVQYVILVGRSDMDVMCVWLDLIGHPLGHPTVHNIHVMLTV